MTTEEKREVIKRCVGTRLALFACMAITAYVVGIKTKSFWWFVAALCVVTIIRHAPYACHLDILEAEIRREDAKNDQSEAKLR